MPDYVDYLIAKKYASLPAEKREQVDRFVEEIEKPAVRIVYLASDQRFRFLVSVAFLHVIALILFTTKTFPHANVLIAIPCTYIALAMIFRAFFRNLRFRL